MRGTSDQQIESLVALTPEDLVPQEHPIRRIKPLADHVLQELSPTLSRMYAKGGRPSVPPEHLLKASLLIALYSVRSERQFCERLSYDMLFRWFLDLNIRGGSFDQPTFAKNRTCFFRWLPRPERPAEGRGEGPACGGRRAEPMEGLPGRAAFQRDPCIDDGPGGAVGAQGARAGGEAVLRRPRAHGEPQWAGGGRGAVAGYRFVNYFCRSATTILAGGHLLSEARRAANSKERLWWTGSAVGQELARCAPTQRRRGRRATRVGREEPLLPGTSE